MTGAGESFLYADEKRKLIFLEQGEIGDETERSTTTTREGFRVEISSVIDCRNAQSVDTRFGNRSGDIFSIQFRSSLAGCRRLQAGWKRCEGVGTGGDGGGGRRFVRRRTE